MSAQDKLQSLLPKRNEGMPPKGHTVKAEQIDKKVQELIRSRELAKTRRIAAKRRWYEKYYGKEHTPELDSEGKPVPTLPEYSPNARVRTARAREEIENRVVEHEAFKQRMYKRELVDDSELKVAFPEYLAHLDSKLSAPTAQLLKKLNIDTRISLSKSELNTVVSGLLMCSEPQLKHVMANSKTPIVVKIIIKALLADLKASSIDIVERLWDRLFGKATQVVQETKSTSVLHGIIPGAQGPVSREAYILIREQLTSETSTGNIKAPYDIEPTKPSYDDYTDAEEVE